jgi:beta-lactam-binding protein with PASTA domain
VLTRSRIAWLVPFAGFIFGYFITYIIIQRGAIITPTVIGKNIQDAASILAQNRLSLRLLREIEDNTLIEGIILDQLPKPEQKIRANQSVFVTISKKSKTIGAPSFINSNVHDASEWGLKHGIELEPVFIYCNSPKNICVAQYPEPCVLNWQKKVTAYFSFGTHKLYIIPSLVGLPVNKVEEIIAHYPIDLEIINLNNNDINNNIVIDQRPISGSIVDLSKPLFLQVQVR